MKNILFLFSFLFSSALLISQDSLPLNATDTVPKSDTVKYWKHGGTVGIAVQQVSLTNWAAGGQNSISGSGLLSMFLTYQKGKLSWNNNLDLAYGVIKQGTNKNWWKNDDRIQFTSKVGLQAIKKWNYAFLLDFKSQFAPGYNYPNDSTILSNFMAPAYALASIGMDYQPNENFSMFISPLTAKITMVYDQKLADAGAFGVQKAEYSTDNLGNLVLLHQGENIRAEFGAYFKMLLKRNVMENVIFATQLELFTNYS